MNINDMTREQLWMFMLDRVQRKGIVSKEQSRDLIQYFHLDINPSQRVDYHRLQTDLPPYNEGAENTQF